MNQRAVTSGIILLFLLIYCNQIPISDSKWVEKVEASQMFTGYNRSQSDASLYNATLNDQEVREKFEENSSVKDWLIEHSIVKRIFHYIPLTATWNIFYHDFYSTYNWIEASFDDISQKILDINMISKYHYKFDETEIDQLTRKLPGIAAFADKYPDAAMIYEYDGLSSKWNIFLFSETIPDSYWIVHLDETTKEFDIVEKHEPKMLPTKSFDDVIDTLWTVPQFQDVVINKSGNYQDSYSSFYYRESIWHWYFEGYFNSSTMATSMYHRMFLEISDDNLEVINITESLSSPSEGEFWQGPLYYNLTSVREILTSGLNTHLLLKFWLNHVADNIISSDDRLLEFNVLSTIPAIFLLICTMKRKKKNSLSHCS
ncbi:MAG: hypothetical protein ACW99Q_07345 [Candidatus Kariarchaeaceae archaeon]|jgi:hypothetical protein